MSKSYVTMEQHICPVCGNTFDTGNLLMDSRLKERFDRYTVTGYSLCPEHQKQQEDGYVFLIELTEPPVEGKEPERTGRIASLKRHVADEMFNKGIKDIAYVDREVFTRLEQMAA